MLAVADWPSQRGGGVEVGSIKSLAGSLACRVVGLLTSVMLDNGAGYVLSLLCFYLYFEGLMTQGGLGGYMWG